MGASGHGSGSGGSSLSMTDKVPIVVNHFISPVRAVAVEVTNHHPSVVVDNVAWVEAHNWWFINRSDGDSLKVGDGSLTLLTLVN